MLTEIREKTAGWLSAVLDQEELSAKIFSSLPAGLPEAAALEIRGVAVPAGENVLHEAVAGISLRRSSAAALNRDISRIMTALPLYDWNGIAALALKSVEYRKTACGGREVFQAELTVTAAFPL